MTAASSDATSEAPTPSALQGYDVKLGVFEGPLDLLLHLIRINEVEITDISISRIAEQYLEYLDLMRELDLDVAGEYLLMAATLAWIKSRMLLPPDGSEVEGEEGDPRAELIARLMEYQRFKAAAGELGERRLLGRDVFEASRTEIEPAPAGEREIEVGLFELIEAFRHALKAAPAPGAAHAIEIEVVTVRDRMIYVMHVLETTESVEFERLLIDENGGSPTRTILVATFLAILELTRLTALRIYQGVNDLGAPEGPIRMRRLVEPGEGEWAAQVAEIM